MSDSLLKANRITVKNDGKRVIDSNAMVSERLKVLQEILDNQMLEPNAADFVEGFSPGLNAEQVEALLGDGEGGDAYGEYEGDFSGEYTQNAEDGGYFQEGLVPAQVSADAQQLIDDATQEADRILQEAQAEAERILANAAQEAEEARKQSMEEGYQQGYDQGHNEGMASVLQMQEELDNKAQELMAEYEQKVSDLEPRFVEELTDIYSHVINIGLEDKNPVILHLLNTAIRNIEGTKSYFVHVAKENYEAVNAAREELMSGLGTQIVLEIIEDITLKEAECFIEADSGIFDCGLGTELELLKKELILLSYRRES